MARSYYNEIDPFAAQWLRNLIGEGLIAPGDVDERSIVDVRADDLKGYTQCHFFAGIGGHCRALDLIGMREYRGWTASTPCPPWSRARIWHRERECERDERDLWPVLFDLYRECRPARLIGEQVAGKKAKRWIDRALKDLASINARVHHETRKAKDFGSPQGRERFYFFANLDGEGTKGLVESGGSCPSRPWRWGGEAHLRAIAGAPFEPGDCWPKPLLRRGDDGISNRVASVRAYGNAVDPFVTAQFIIAAREAIDGTH